jgi:16S rRNA (cytosine1402-N4)-methyltransferase
MPAAPLSQSTLPFRRLVLATTNPHKFRELADLLPPLGVPLLSLVDVPDVSPVSEDGSTLAANARLKASGYAARIGEWVLADDTGLEVDALAGAPGVRSARYAGDDATMADNRARLLRELEQVPGGDRTARFVCCLALANPAGEIAAEATGVCRGKIRRDPAGTGGFGYDSLFEVAGTGATLAELSPDQTVALGHRGHAVRQLLATIAGQGEPAAPSDKPARRPRYSGTHPRQFHEKYKEQQPERYAADVARVVASGRTPAGSHRPIMVREILEFLAPRPGEVAVDCTLGYGGHARELLAAIQPGGTLLAVDVDPHELPRTEARLRRLGFPPESLKVRRSNFAGVAQFITEAAPGGADLLLADLGLSSMQLDDPERGFTFKTDGPLDMRMNPTRGRTAAELLSQLDVNALAQLFMENADEAAAAGLAAAILQSQARTPLTTTRSLADVVRSAYARLPHDPRNTPDDAVRRVFQALRIAVNDELGALDALLRTLPWCLKPGGRVAILTFHSGEDRRVKMAFKQGERDGIFRSVPRRPIRPSADERRSNPRSAAAKLRCAIRAAAG